MQEFWAFFCVILKRLAHYLPCIYRISTVYLPYIYRISTVYLPYIYRISTVANSDVRAIGPIGQIRLKKNFFLHFISS